MSFYHHTEEKFKTVNEVIPNKHSFDAFIMQCCKAPEKELRKFLKKVLIRNGFTITEDDYKSDRKDTEGVHNMLAVRGKNPRVCLVAHTDVCREHEAKTSSNNWKSTSQTSYQGAGYGEYSGYGYNSEFPYSGKPSNNPNAVAPPPNTTTALATTTKTNEDSEDRRYKNYWHNKEKRNPSSSQSQLAPKEEVVKTIKVDPVMYYQENDKKEYRHIITDRGNKLQVGGDDRLGVAINVWVAINTGHDMALFFPTDEEIGLKSSEFYKGDDLNKFDLLLQVDRGNHSHQLVVKIGNTQLCNYLTACRLLSISHNMGIPRTPVTGLSTDVAALKRNKRCKEAVNMTCGYHKSYGAGTDEFIWVEEAIDTMRYVHEIVKSYEYEDIYEATDDVEV